MWNQVEYKKPNALTLEATVTQSAKNILICEKILLKNEKSIN